MPRFGRVGNVYALSLSLSLIPSLTSRRGRRVVAHCAVTIEIIN